MMRGPQTCSPTGQGGKITTKTLDKHHNDRPMANTNSTPPLRINRNPFTPRLAGSPARQESPTLRKDGRTVPNEASTGNPKEDIATPVKSFLNSNITPRSGARKARVDSASSTPKRTPKETPSSSKPASTVGTQSSTADDVRARAGLGMQGGGSSQSPRRRSIASEALGASVGLGLASLSRDLYGRRAASPENSPQFFHASDANSAISARTEAQRPKLQAKTASFFRANGEEELDDAPSSISTSPAFEQQEPKFFYANGVPEKSPQSPKSASFGVSSFSLVSTTSPQRATFSPIPRAIPPRPPSPLKDGSLSRKSSSSSKVSSRQHTRLISNSSAQKPEPKPLDTPSPLQLDSARRPSVSTPVKARLGHVKALSVSSIVPSPLPKQSVSTSGPRASVLIEPSNKTVAEEPESIKNATQGAPTPVIATFSRTPKSSPGQSKLDQMNELAANARRERKVLDLEISNSSLLAINRTLEREMRKQNAELRRFRRLSRSGRLSMATTTRSTSDQLSTLGESDNLSDISGFSDEEDGDELELSDDEDSVEDGMLSPDAQAERDARIRAKDEKRLQLDLSKHHELLIDSQKLNQGLKRCLGWTEELISQGKKALEYQVRISDIEVGGRVLAPDENELETTHSRGLLSPVNVPVGNPWDFGGGERESVESEVDRDSGVDIARTPDLGSDLKSYVQSPGDDLRL